MKPSLSLLDGSFRYVPAVATSVAMTWRRFGWRSPSDLERRPRLTARPTYAVRRIDGAALRGVEVISDDGEGSLISGATKAQVSSAALGNGDAGSNYDGSTT